MYFFLFNLTRKYVNCIRPIQDDHSSTVVENKSPIYDNRNRIICDGRHVTIYPSRSFRFLNSWAPPRFITTVSSPRWISRHIPVLIKLLAFLSNSGKNSIRFNGFRTTMTPICGGNSIWWPEWSTSNGKGKELVSRELASCNNASRPDNAPSPLSIVNDSFLKNSITSFRIAFLSFWLCTSLRVSPCSVKSRFKWLGLHRGCLCVGVGETKKWKKEEEIRGCGRSERSYNT